VNCRTALGVLSWVVLKSVRTFLGSFVLAASFLVGAGVGTARAEELSLAEHARLARGATVARHVTIENGEHRLVGGITYTVLHASPAELLPLFDDPAAYQELLPRTKEAKITRDGTVRHLSMRTGNAVVEGVYTLYLQQATAQEFRFWLDPRAPHDIDDAYGYFRFEALAPTSDGEPRTLLTYAIAIDIGPGIVRELFEERVRAASLAVPQALVARITRDRPQMSASR
jgi:hypothetical protein